MAYKKQYVPYLRGVVDKITHAAERLRTERGIIGLCLGVDYLGEDDKEQLRQVLAYFEGAEETINTLTRRIKSRVKILDNIN